MRHLVIIERVESFRNRGITNVGRSKYTSYCIYVGPSVSLYTENEGSIISETLLTACE
jgi:hypothetical protein